MKNGVFGQLDLILVVVVWGFLTHEYFDHATNPDWKIAGVIGLIALTFVRGRTVVQAIKEWKNDKPAG
jgi:hypothetical protein